MNEQDEQLRTELMEGMLEYLEGNKSYRSVLTLGINATNKIQQLKNKNIVYVVSELNKIGNNIGNGNNYSRIKMNEIFTELLEKLTIKT